MIYKNIWLHNVEELIWLEDRKGILLQRIPEYVRRCLRPNTQNAYRKPSGVEIRFISGWEPASITLISYQGESKAWLFFGDFQVGEYVIKEEETTIEIPEPIFLSKPGTTPGKFNFHPSVIRLLLSGNEIHLVEVNGLGIRPPNKDQMPALKYLAYGTSITHGEAASSPALAYAKQTAWRLGADVFNLGASGAAYCEKELADYIANRKDWDFATVCISVNMLNQGVSVEEFYHKAKYLVNTIAAKNQGKPIICISLFPFFMDVNIHLRWPTRGPVCGPEDYRKALERIVEELELTNVHLVGGDELLKDVTLLSHDLIHPGDYGMIQIAQNLAEFIRPILGGAGS